MPAPTKEAPAPHPMNGDGPAIEKAATQPKDAPPAPPNGGTAAWLLVLAAHLTFVNTWYADRQ
jgi:hypothetical protein